MLRRLRVIEVPRIWQPRSTRFLRSTTFRDGPGASVIVIKDGRVLYKKAYGLADVEGKVRATTRTNYRLASVTKQFTAMSILILAERKQLIA